MRHVLTQCSWAKSSVATVRLTWQVETGLALTYLMKCGSSPGCPLWIMPTKLSRLPVSGAARSKAWVCGRPFSGIAGSNLVEGMDVCLLWVLCVGLITHAEESYRVVCVCVWLCSLDNEEVQAHWGCGAIGGGGGGQPSQFFECNELHNLHSFPQTIRIKSLSLE